MDRRAEDPAAGRGRRRTWLWVLAALVVAALVQWAIHVGSPPTIDATGVDTLTIPLDDLDTVDFVDEVDNPWLPLVPGTRWVYEGEVGQETTTRVVEVLDDPVEVAGVRATQVRTTVDGATTVRLHAQDEAGNVWLLGQVGEWVAGDGTPAGLTVPAEPRRGDGFVRVPGDALEWWRIGERVTGVQVPAGTYGEALAVDETDAQDASTHLLLVRGVGVVRTETAGGDVLELVEHTAG